MLLVAGIGIGAIVAPDLIAWSKGEEVAVNLVIPVAVATWRAHRHQQPLSRALLRGIAGGVLLFKGMEKGAHATEADPWRAWQAKLLVNAGSSLIESAHTATVTWRIDFGPAWVITDGVEVKVRPALHSSISMAIALAEGARPNLHKSLRLGTPVFTRRMNRDGTIGYNGALAYTKGNLVNLNPAGDHAGHEMVHAFQYRRDAAYLPKITDFDHRLRYHCDPVVDDTSWFVNWVAQRAVVNHLGENMDFQSPMEREAYYLSEGIR